MTWRRIATAALAVGAVLCSGGYPSQVRHDVSHPLTPVQRVAHHAVIQLLSYDAGGGGTGGGGDAARPPLRLRAMAWAHRQRGKWYCWGGTGPGCFDCSGLVYRAYLAQGIDIGRTTYEMLGNRHLRLVRGPPQRGDIAFYGSGHVELVWQPRWHRTFGAHDTGSRIGSIKWGPWWHPTAYYKIV